MIERELDAGEGRVRCWFCQNWTHHLQTKVFEREDPTNPDSAWVERWHDCRTCVHGLGHDPLIPRRCDHFKAVEPQYRLPLPAWYLKRLACLGDG